MNYSQELKVGIAIIVAAVVFFVGLRFFQDIPIFQNRYTLQAEFDDAGGLVSGNPVQMKGVSVGTVERVRLDPARQKVHVRFRVDDTVEIPRGSYTEVTGFSALSGVRLAIIPGPAGNDPYPPGSTLPGPPTGGVLERLSDQAPVLASKADSVLSNASAALGGLNRQVNNPSSDLRKLINQLQQTTANLNEMTGREDAALRSTLRNLETITRDLETFVGADTSKLRANNLGEVSANLNRSLARLDSNLVQLQTTTASLNEMTRKMNEGDGTIGRLVNDPSLYIKLDSAAARSNRILLDLKENPGRYLEDMTLVKVF